MKKLFTRIGKCLLAGAAVCGIGLQKAEATGWPLNYEGVMLQGFYWDSYSDTKWTNLEKNADEYSQYFKLIWVPNSAYSGGGTQMGYAPIYWFTNHNSSFGKEAELRSMIATYKAKGVGIIEDVVINHRNGKSNWTDFPEEVWNGTTWKIGPEGICCTDEVKYATGQATPTGAPDTGEDFNGARDLDHTNWNVQNNCKNYCKFLIDDMGYAGFRLDMTKGYGGEYTKIYNQYSKPKFCVGEFFDSNYDLLAAWIEATGKESAAFDFAFKYQVNKCFNGGGHNYNELVWKAWGVTDQPAGLIHCNYGQYAVTFVDNHDTYRDGSKMTGDVLAANAFLLSCPGTPCVFLPHYKQFKTQIQAMINARNGVGIHNCSPVNVLEVNGNCYVAEVTGSKGKLWIKLGNSSRVAGNGYTKKAYGPGYEIWTTASGAGQPDIPKHEGPVDIYFQKPSTWTTPHIHHWGGEESTWPGVKMTKVNGTSDIYSYTCPEGTTGILFNNGDGDASKTSDFYANHGHLYTVDGDQGEYGVIETPDELYLIGNLPEGAWNPSKGVKMTKNGNKFSVTTTLAEAGTAAKPDANSYFSFTSGLGATWDDLNGNDRYGAATKDEAVSADGPAVDVCAFPANINASSANSWKIPAGNYTFTVDFENMQLTVTGVATVVNAIDITGGSEAVWFNLQGQRVESPGPGIFIRVTNGKADKVIVR